MSAYRKFVLLVAGILALPLLVTPQGWMIAGVLVALWLLLSLGTPALLREWLDLKQKREQGVRAAAEQRERVEDTISGAQEHYRRER